MILVGWSKDSYDKALSAVQNTGLHVQYGGYTHDNSLTAFVPVGASGVPVPLSDVSAEHVVQGYRVPATSREDCMLDLAPIEPLYTLTPESMARYDATPPSERIANMVKTLEAVQYGSEVEIEGPDVASVFKSEPGLRDAGFGAIMMRPDLVDAMHTCWQHTDHDSRNPMGAALAIAQYANGHAIAARTILDHDQHTTSLYHSAQKVVEHQIPPQNLGLQDMAAQAAQSIHNVDAQWASGMAGFGKPVAGAEHPTRTDTPQQNKRTPGADLDK